MQMSDFTDDASMSSLRTVLAHNQPSEFLFGRAQLSAGTNALLHSVLGQSLARPLARKDVWSAEQTLKNLTDDKYLGADLSQWPEHLKNSVLDLEEPIPRPSPDQEVALSALGTVLAYLTKCLIDVDMVTMRKFTPFEPSTLHFGQRAARCGPEGWRGASMVLDSYALNALHLLPDRSAQPRSNRSAEARNAAKKLDTEANNFSLFSFVNHCCTPFGKRELRRWLCTPSCDPDVLLGRQAAVHYLSSAEGLPLLDQLQATLKKVPDLERLFQRQVLLLNVTNPDLQHPRAGPQVPRQGPSGQSGANVRAQKVRHPEGEELLPDAGRHGPAPETL